MAIANTTTEEWRPIPEWEGLYEASSHGRIRRLHKHTPPRIVKSRPNRFGYIEIGLKRRLCKQQWIFVHRLVASAFNGPIPDKHQVDHADDCKSNNCPYNLEYVTPKEHARRSYERRLQKQPWGPKIGDPRVCIAAVKHIRSSSESDIELGEKYGVSAITVYLIRRRLRYKHVE